MNNFGNFKGFFQGFCIISRVQDPDIRIQRYRISLSGNFQVSVFQTLRDNFI